MSDSIREIKSINEYHFCVGKIMFFCQCIEHDIKLVYNGMRETISNKELKEIEKWTLGKTLNELQELDNSDGRPYFSYGDYELLNSIKDIRNYYAHECYTEFVYEQNKELDKKFTKSIKRLINDHNRLAKLYGLIEKARLRFFGFE